MKGEIDWKKHEAAVARKKEKIGILSALVKEWEEHEEPDFEYLRELKARLRSAEQNLVAMRP